MPATLESGALPVFADEDSQATFERVDYHQHRLIRYWGDDLPWWYSERASTSVLAGAAWRTRAFAFEEYAADKKTGKKRKPLFPGRVDLYLKVKGQQFIAEGKYYWSAATFVSPATITENLRNKLHLACEGIRICPRYGQTRLGILFAMPYIAKSKDARVDELLETWLAAMMKVRCSCSAWVFPRTSRHIAGEAICPGAAVLIKEV